MLKKFPSVLKKREDTFWEFRELLPLSSLDSVISLGEPYTPVLRLSTSCCTASKNVYVKDDIRLPTVTFKARGMAVAVYKLKWASDDFSSMFRKGLVAV